MNKYVEVKTQAELDKALAAGDIPEIRGSGEFVVRDSIQVRACDSSQVAAHGSSQVRACDSSQVRAYDSSQVTAYGSSQVRAHDSSQVTAYGSSQVRAYDSSQVTACDSSQVRACDSSQVSAYGSSQVRACGSSQVAAHDSSQVTAYGSSQVRAHGSSQVTACDSSQVTAHDSSQVTAGQYNAVTVHGASAKVKGGQIIKCPKLRTAKQWCEFYGVEVTGGVAILFKALDENFVSLHGMSYAPGSIPEAPDWDGGAAECGGGLHFSPRAFMALEFKSDAKKFAACPVKLRDIKIHPDASMPQKCKAKKCCGPVWECDIDGNRVEQANV